MTETKDTLFLRGPIQRRADFFHLTLQLTFRVLNWFLDGQSVVARSDHFQTSSDQPSNHSVLIHIRTASQPFLRSIPEESLRGFLSHQAVHLHGIGAVETARLMVENLAPKTTLAPPSPFLLLLAS